MVQLIHKEPGTDAEYCFILLSKKLLLAFESQKRHLSMPSWSHQLFHSRTGVLFKSFYWYMNVWIEYFYVNALKFCLQIFLVWISVELVQFCHIRKLRYNPKCRYCMLCVNVQTSHMVLHNLLTSGKMTSVKVALYCKKTATWISLVFSTDIAYHIYLIFIKKTHMVVHIVFLIKYNI